MNGSTTANSPPQNHPTPDNNKKVFITTIQNSNDTGCEKHGSRTDYVSNVVISSAANSQKNSIVNIQPPSTLSITDNTEHLPTLNSSNHILSNKIHTEIWEQQTIGRGVVPLINIENDDDNSSDSDSFATSPILPMQRKLSLMPALTEEDLLNSDLGQKDPVFVAKVFGQDFATQLSSKNETSPRGDFVTSDVKKTLFSNEDNFLHLSLHSNSPLWPFAPRDETIPSGVPTLKIRVLQNNPQSPTTQTVTRKLGSFSHSTRPTLSPSSKESIRPNLSASNKESFDHTKVNREDPNKAIEAPYKEYSVLLAPDPLPRNIVPTKFHFSLPPTHFSGNSSPSPFTHHSHLFPTSLNSTTHLKNKLTPEMLKFAHSLDYDDDKNLATEHTDMITFQLSVTKWLLNQVHAQSFGFILIPQDSGDTTFVNVTSQCMLRAPIACCKKDSLKDIFEDVVNISSDSTGIYLADVPPHILPTFDNILIALSMQNIPPATHENQKYEVNYSPNSIEELRQRCTLFPVESDDKIMASLLVLHGHKSLINKQVNLISPHMQMIGSLMTIVINVDEQKRLARQSEIFLSMAQNVFSSIQDMNLLVRNITKEAKRLVHAEICSLFLLDKEHDELVAEVFEQNGTKDEFLTEIRMPLSQGIVGYVATTGKMLNVNDVYNNPYFYSKVDERTGFVTRNILCFPIKDSSENLVGVAELCNKVGDIGFTKNDERIASTFSVYCAISISHCLLYRKLQEAHRRSHMAAELLVQGSTLSIAPEDILRLTVRDIPSPSSFHADFNNFTFVPRSIGSGDIYVEASLSMFKDLGFIDKYRLRRRTLARFLLMVQKGYRDVPYHNWSHSYATGHFCYLLLRLPMVQNYLNDLERLSLLVACLCHDIDHRGTTNAFQLQSKTPLAQLYSSEGSVLERHHFAQTVTILGMDECNIFEQLTRQQYQQVLDNIREIILATDIAAHLRKVTKIKEMVHCGFNPDIPEHHYLFMCLLMTASDLSDQSKDFKTTKSIAENIYKEFFSQGDLEKQMGNAPMTMMDREKACVPKIQLEFMDTVALPVFKYLSDILPDLDRTYDTLQKNRVCWSTMQTLLDEEGSDPGSLEFLRDTELESRVYTKITDRNTKQIN